MQTVYCQEDLCRVKSCALLIEAAFPPQMREELSSVQEVNDEVELLGSLKGVVELHDEGVRYFLEDLSLGYSGN
jgi:hypothetical protein